MHYAKQPVKCYTWLFKETWSCDLTICLTWKISMHTYTSRLCELSLFETKCKAHPRFSFFRFFCNLALSYLHSATKKKKTFQLPRNNICGKFFKIMYQLPRNLANLNICRFSMLDMLQDKNCTIWPPKCHIKHLPTVHKRLPYLNTVLK